MSRYRGSGDRGCPCPSSRRAGEVRPGCSEQLASGGRGLILAGNAREPHEPGPRVITEEQIRNELVLAFQILDVHEFRFDEAFGVS
jgi:hypothetical protein